MRSGLVKKSIIISVVLLFSGAAVVFARGGYGGYGMGYGPGYGGHMMGYYGGGYGGYGMGPGMMGYGYGMGPGMMGYGYRMGPGMMGYGPAYGPGWQGYAPNLTDAQRAKLDAARDKFFQETEGLRDKIQNKRAALYDELRKAEPDAGKVTKLQKELSELRGEFDLKAVQYRLEVRKMLPETATEGRYGYGPGYGGGYCWR